ncbi:MAG: DUF1565 domain-containing protein [bacterium]|nr:DUF1565 domain-containing protein [bacterium]
MKLARLFFLLLSVLLFLALTGCKKDKEKEQKEAKDTGAIEKSVAGGRSKNVGISIENGSVGEGDEGSTTLKLTVFCSAEPRKNRDITVKWSTSNATGTSQAQATVGEDYTSNSGDLTFTEGGSLQQDIVVTVKSDTEAEEDEMFLVTLYQPVNATIANGVGEGLIINDDAEDEIINDDAEDESTFYVSNDGNDENKGTRESPFATLAKGVSILSAGYTLYVFPGNYMERLHVNGKLGTVDAPIVIKAEKGVVLDGPDNYSGGQRQNIRIKDSAYVVVDGFEGRNSALSGVHISSSSSHITLRNLKIHNAKDHGVSIEGTDVVLENSTIANNVLNNENESASHWGSGIKVRLAKNVTLKRNRVDGNWGEGIAATRSDHVKILENLVIDNYSVNIYVDNSRSVYVKGNFSYNSSMPIVQRDGRKAHGITTAEEHYSDWGNQLEQIWIMNNIVFNCYTGFTHNGSDKGEGGLRSALVYNNTFYNIEYWGINIKEDRHTNLEFRNNIIHVKDGAHAISYFRDDWNTDGAAQGVTLGNNLWVTKRPDEDIARVSSTSDVEGQFPGFKIVPDFSVVSFQLSSSSPVLNIGAPGISDPLWNNDVENNTRDIEKSDLGALEHGGTQEWFDAFFGL